MTGQLLAFLGVSAAVICTPGQDTALTIRNTVAGGRRAGVATGAGVALGQAAWTVATVAGVASLVAASRPAFVALQLLGAAYLVWLGGQTVVRALRGRSASPAPRCAGDASARSALRQGALSNLANPKMAVFFIALLPQFAPSGPLAYPALLALGLCFGLLTFAWLGVVSTGVARTSRLLVRDRVRRLVEAVTGAMLVGLGVRLATHRA